MDTESQQSKYHRQSHEIFYHSKIGFRNSIHFYVISLSWRVMLLSILTVDGIWLSIGV